MKSFPYERVSPEVQEVVTNLLMGCDDYHRVHRARLARTVDLIYRMKPEGRMLEIGTSGFVPLALKRLLPKLKVDVTHFDKSGDVSRLLDFEMNKRKISKVQAWCVDLEYDVLPIEDDTYDFILCGEVLEHMEIDPMFMLSELNRVLKDQASLLLTTPNVLSSRGLAKIAEGVEPYFYMQYHKSREYHRHNYEYSARSLYSLLTAAGFQAEVWSEDLFEDGLPKVVEQFREAGVNVTHVGDNLIARCTKVSPVVERFPSGIYD